MQGLGASQSLASELFSWGAFLSLNANFIYHASMTTWKVHRSADATNALASVVAPVTLLDCIARLADIASKFNAHRVNTSGGVGAEVHPVADTTNVFTPPALVVLSDAITYYWTLRTTFFGHATYSSSHDQSVANNPVDGGVGDFADIPVDLATLKTGIVDLMSLYENHRVLLTGYSHYTSGAPSPDTSNIVSYSGLSLPDLIKHCNDLANAINNHVQNLDKTGTPAVTPYHYSQATGAPTTRLVVTRASDARTAIICAEECFLAFYDHLLNGGGGSIGSHQHRGQSWGRYSAYATSGNGASAANMYPAILRLQKRFFDITSASVPPVQLQANATAVYLVTAYGWT